MHNEHFASMWENNSMCVEAILDSRRNVSAYIKKSEIQTFQRCCQITTEELANKPISNVRVSLALNESSLESGSAKCVWEFCFLFNRFLYMLLCYFQNLQPSDRL